MRHQVAGKKLNRSTNHRQSLFKIQLKQLIDKKSLTTTLTKAKILKVNAEKLLIKAQDNSVHNLRQIEASLSSKTHAIKAVKLAQNLKTDQAFLSLTRIDKRRGDNTMMAKVSILISPEPETKTDSIKSNKKITKPSPKAKTKPVKTAKK